MIFNKVKFEPCWKRCPNWGNIQGFHLALPASVARSTAGYDFARRPAYIHFIVYHVGCTLQNIQNDFHFNFKKLVKKYDSLLRIIVTLFWKTLMRPKNVHKTFVFLNDFQLIMQILYALAYFVQLFFVWIGSRIDTF